MCDGFWPTSRVKNTKKYTIPASVERIRIFLLLYENNAAHDFKYAMATVYSGAPCATLRAARGRSHIAKEMW